jgi:hypothetical protein
MVLVKKSEGDGREEDKRLKAVREEKNEIEH